MRMRNYNWYNILLLLIFLLPQSIFAGKRETKRVNVGDQITLYSTYHSYTQSVLWNWDTGVLELVGSLYATSTSATFKVKKASPLSGVVVQATTYYHKSNTTATGINKDLDTWTIYATDNSTVSLSSSSVVMDQGESMYITATASNSSYSGQYMWKSYNTNVAYISGSGKRVILNAYAPGTTKIRVTLDNNNYAECQVTVNKVDPQSATISSPISIYTDQSKSLTVSVYPSNAKVDSKTWYVASGKEYVSLTSSGYLTGLKPGVADVYCLINNQVYSNTAQVIVTEPTFNIQQIYPQNNATEVSSLVAPSITYSLDVYEADDYADIQLQNLDNQSLVEGSVVHTGKKVTFTPTQALQPLTNYQLIIPQKAVRSKWGAYIDSAFSICFKTSDWDKLSLTFSDENQFVPVGSKVHLRASVADAKIFYTTDGTRPTVHSTIYTDSISIERDMKIRAFAMRDGYLNSDTIEKIYLVSDKSIAQKFPEKEQLYVYDDVNPYVKFNIAIQTSDHISEITLTKQNGQTLDGQVIVADSSIFFIPDQPLEKGCMYNMYIPANAVLTKKGESNDSFTWTFSTGDYVRSIAMGAEMGAAFKTDGQILTWGSIYQSGNHADGSYEMSFLPNPTSLAFSDVDTIAIGYMHSAYIKNDSSLWMCGRQYCGEFGVNSHIGTNVPIKVMDSVLYVSAGAQHTAIIKSDHSLWMVGRNDFGQLGDSSVVTKLIPVKVLENVSQVAAGWGITFAITSDYQLYGWGRNDKSQLGNSSSLDSWRPIKLADDVASVATSVVEGKYTAIIKRDGSLWVFGTEYSTPTKILEDVTSVAVGVDYIQAVKSDNTLWAMGGNSLGQLGTVARTDSESPIFIRDSVLQVGSGGQTTVALMHNGSVWTWGSNMNKLLGYDAQSFSSTPAQVIEGMSRSTLSGVTPRKMLYRMVTGERNVITTIPEPLNADYAELYWSCFDENVATVSQRGVITALSPGETDLFIRIQDHQNHIYERVCHIIVSDPKPPATTETEELTICPSELPLEWYGQTLTEAGVYTATEKYAGMECDSVIHELTLNVYERSFLVTIESSDEAQGSVNIEINP